MIMIDEFLGFSWEKTNSLILTEDLVIPLVWTTVWEQTRTRTLTEFVVEYKKLKPQTRTQIQTKLKIQAVYVGKPTTSTDFGPKSSGIFLNFGCESRLEWSSDTHLQYNGIYFRIKEGRNRLLNFYNRLLADNSCYPVIVGLNLRTGCVYICIGMLSFNWPIKKCQN